jgi:DNA polymerase phi
VDSEDFNSLVWPALLEAIQFKRETLTLEHIWLLLTIRKTFPGGISKKFFPNALGRKKLVCSELCEDVARNLNATSIPINIIRRHPLFPILMGALRDEGLLKTFWIDHVNPFLAKDNGSSYKTLLAFGILSVILEAATDDEPVEEYLTTNVIESALAFLSRIESSSDDDAKLLQVLGKFCDRAKAKEEMQVPVLKAFLTEPGSVCFDKLTGGALVHKLIMECKPAAVKYVATSLLRPTVLGTTSGNSQPTTQERVYAAQQLAKLTSHPAMQDDLEWKRDTIKFLLAVTLFKVDKKSKVTGWVPEPLSKECLAQMRATFFKSLDFKTRSLDDLCNLLMEVFEHAKELKEKVPLAYPLKDKSEEAWASVVKTISNVAKRRMKGGKKEDAVFLLFFVHMAFHLLSDQEMACEMLEELHECHQRSTLKSKRKSMGEKEPHWVEVVTELLISLQSQNQLALRHLASSVFKMICTNTTTESLQAILDVIDVAEESKEGGDEEEEDEGWEDMSSGDEDESADKDEEDISSNDADSDDDDEDDDDDDNADGENEDDPGEDFKKKVRAALGDHAAAEGSDESGSGDDDQEDDDVDMDDIPQEDLDKMDEALANVFKQLSGGKKSGAQLKKERKETLAKVHFRVRCLDLLDVYLSQEPRGVHVLLALQRIMSALEKSKSKAEEDFRKRLLNSLKKVAGLKKNLQQIQLSEDGGDEIQGELFVSVLQSMVELANRGSPLIATLENPIPLYAQCCFLVLKIGQLTKDSKVNKQMEEIYFKAVDDFFKHRFVHGMVCASFRDVMFCSNLATVFCRQHSSHCPSAATGAAPSRSPRRSGRAPSIPRCDSFVAPRRSLSCWTSSPPSAARRRSATASRRCSRIWRRPWLESCAG